MKSRWVFPTVVLFLVALVPFLLTCKKDSTSPGGDPPAACQVSVPSLHFGEVVMGQSYDQGFSITNTGGGTLSGTVSAGCAGFSIVGNATYALAAGQAQNFTVRFAPTGVGSASCTVSTGSAACSSIACSGSCVASTACEITPTALDYGTVMVGQSADRTFTIKNNGRATLTGTVSAGCSGFSVVGTAAYSLALGQSQTFTVRFTPTQAGAASCDVSTGSVLCPALPASGTGELPVPCQVSTTSLDFADVTVGQTSDLTFSITNSGIATLTGTVSAPCAGFSIVGVAAYTLTPGQSQTFSVRFAPTQAGIATCTVATGSSSCPTVAATGTGTPGPTCQVAPTTLDFGEVASGQSTDRSFVITNTGGGTLSGTVGLNCAGFSVVGNGGYALTAGRSQTFTVRFTPSVAGTVTCTVTTGAAGCANVAATGTGTPGPGCVVLPSSLDFGDVTTGQSADRTFAITNSGTGALAGTITVTCAWFSIVGDADYSLAPGQSKTFTIRFSPTQTGSASCVVGTGAAICSSVSAVGVGVTGPTCQVAPTSLDFGSVTVGQNADRTFVITNVGSLTLSGTVSTASAGFSIVGNASYTLAASQSQTFTVRFAPAQTGAASGTVATGSPACANVALSGTGLEGVVCDVSPTTLDFGNVTVGQSADRSFTITNLGSTTLSDTVEIPCPQFHHTGYGTYSIPAGQYRSFTVRYTPTQAGPATCTIITGAPGCPNVSASGTGVSQPSTETAYVRVWITDTGSYFATNIHDRTFEIYGSTSAGVTNCGRDISFGTGGGIGVREPGHTGIRIDAYCDTVRVYMSEQYQIPNYDSAWGIDVGVCQVDDYDITGNCGVPKVRDYLSSCRGGADQAGYTKLGIVYAGPHGSVGYANDLYWFFKHWMVPAGKAPLVRPLEDCFVREPAGEFRRDVSALPR